jgi:hypothetical protein
VLGPATLATRGGPIGAGVRTGSLAELALLACPPIRAHPRPLTADLHPTDKQTAAQRVHTDVNTVRTTLRKRPDRWRIRKVRRLHLHQQATRAHGTSDGGRDALRCRSPSLGLPHTGP